MPIPDEKLIGGYILIRRVHAHIHHDQEANEIIHDIRREFVEELSTNDFLLALGICDALNTLGGHII